MGSYGLYQGHQGFPEGHPSKGHRPARDKASRPVVILREFLFSERRLYLQEQAGNCLSIS